MLNQTDLSRVDLNLLVLFEIVLQEKHVGRAAGRLNLSPSAISHGLGRLRRLLHDPLFVRTPKGVVPTDRALELAGPISDILTRVRGVIEVAAPFDPATSSRRFTIGAPDGVSAVLLPPLLEELRRAAPHVNISLRQLLPTQGEITLSRAWRGALSDLEARAMDIAVIPNSDVPARFQARSLGEEDFVLAMRPGHPFLAEPTLGSYCQMQHLVVSLSGDPYGFVDEVLARSGHARRVALTVPNFMFALAVIAGTDLVTALPRQFAQRHAAQFGVVCADPPLPLGRFQISAIIPHAALADTGLAWLYDALGRAAAST
jgi:DNA-binding transcriptional LysR family regulator